MKKLSISVVWTFLFSSLLLGQVTLFSTYDTIKYYDFIQSDGFYMLGDHYVSPKKDIILQSTDPQGEINWIKQYNYEEYLSCRDFLRNQEGDLIILGVESGRESGNPTDTSSNIYIIKTESDGDTLWTSKIDIKKFDYPTSIIEANDDGYIITGLIYDTKPYNKDILLLKINSEGDMIWWKTFGTGYTDEGYDIVPDVDYGYLITGTYNYDGTDQSFAFLLKTDANGDSVWMKKYDHEDYLFGKSLIRTNDGGLIISADRTWRREKAGLIKTNATGDTIWTKSYDFDNGEENFQTIIQTSDKGYLIGGYKNGNVGVRPPYSQMAVFKTDSIGNPEWEKVYRHVPWPTKIHKYITGLIETTDGYYVLSVNESSHNTLFFKLDFNGCYLQSPLINGDDFFCSLDSTRLFTESVYNSLTWSTESTNDEIYVNTTGKYSLTIIDTNDCRILSDSFEIIEHQPPDLNIEPDGPTTICYGNSVKLTAQIANYDPLRHYSYSWYPGQYTVDEKVTYNTGMFSLQVEDGFCKSSDSLEVVVHYPSQEKICIVTMDRATGRNLTV